METRIKETRVLGDYTIIKQIGQGSLGTVFLAEHRFMKKQYVLKVLPEELSSDRTFIQRFEEEVGLLASLDHPNIVKIHNISFSHGQYFLVTDCVVDELGETTNLGQYLLARNQRLDEEVIYRLLYELASALDYAHSKEAVHRGLKLNNILVGKGKSGNIELSLSDFGLSKIIGPASVLTRTYKNMAEGLGITPLIASAKAGQERYPTPSIEMQKLIPLHTSFLQNYIFLAPEQKKLDYPKVLDGKVDNYAFGVLAYYMLTGDFPEGFFEMPSENAVDLKWDWDALVRSCLQTDPAKRPEFLVPLMESIRQEEKSVYASSIKQVAYQEAIYKEARDASEKVSEPGHLRPIIHSAQIERPNPDMDPTLLLQVDPTVKQYTPERKEIKNIQPIQTEMVVVTGGTFLRGSSDGNRDEMPQHQIVLPSFAIDIHPVTNEQFVRFLEAMGGEKDGNHHDIIRLRDSRIKRSGGKVSIESGYSKHPVVGVTWYGAVAYAKWVGKRLPTEAEWEIAARGGLENVLYPTGEDIEKTQANFFSSDTIAVMSYASNAAGIYDMAGNVYEWCHDWYGYNYYEVSVQEPENPKGPLQGVYRVLRGGCWKSLKEDLRCSRRHRNNPGAVNGTYGFRCAADVQ
jgi:formylglycine-generating enzyme required for sulfatase activity/tRNA A-37 threonylcarbamoyl transferase component Bud32